MKKKTFHFCYLLCSFLFLIAFALGIAAYNPALVEASAAGSFTADAYKTAGASVRLFEKDGTPIQDGTAGIRFHVLMDAELYNAYKDDENFKTYTAILPEYLFSGELNTTTANVLTLETTDVWVPYKKDNAYMESVAFVYGLPSSQYATNLVFRGFVSFDGGANMAAQTEIGNRSMAFVAKSARDDSGAAFPDPEKEAARLSVLNEYIPKYTVNYTVGNSTTTEDTEYGKPLSAVPQGVSIWKNEKGERVDVSQPITATATKAISLTAYATVTVNLTNSSATLNGTSVSNGSAVEVKCGSHSLVTSPITDYKLSSVTVNGSNKGSSSSHTLSVTGNTTVSVVSSIITYTVSLDNSGGASVSGTINGTFNIRSTCSFTLGVGFYKVTVNGTEISPNASRGYSFTVTSNSTVKIVKMTDSETTSKILNVMASASGGTLQVSGNTIVSTYNSQAPNGGRGTITISQAVFDELKKYGYTTITFDMYKKQKKELLYRKRIQNITDNVTVAEVGTNKDSISASNVSISKPTTFESQYKSFGSWSGESDSVAWTFSNIRFS